MAKKARIKSEFVSVSEFNVIENSKSIIAEAILMHSKLKKIVDAYKSYMDANNYSYSHFMSDIDVRLKAFEEFINSFDTNKNEKQGTLKND
jgi:type I restriction-modification system DNA methylase subunit